MQVLGLNREYIKSFDTFPDAYIESELCLVPTLIFSVPINLGRYFKEEYYIQLEDDGEYIVKEKKKSSGRYDVTCKPNLDDFLKDFHSNYTYTTDTCQNTLNKILKPIGWTCECSDSRQETLTGKDKTTLDVVLHAMELYEYEWVWDIKDKKIIAGPFLGEDKGAYLHQEVNLRELNTSSHSYDLVTRLVPKGKDDLGIELVNGGVPYLEPTIKYTDKIIYGIWRDERFTIAENLKEKGQKLIDSLGVVHKSYEADVIDLAKLTKKYNYLSYSLGDILTLVDEHNGIYNKERVIRKKEYLKDKVKNSVILSNAPLNANQVRKQIETDLADQLKVTKQYISVLEGEIKQKVSKDEYEGIDHRLSNAEQKLTDEFFNSIVEKLEKVEGSTESLKSEFLQRAESLELKLYEESSSLSDELKNLLTYFRWDSTGALIGKEGSPVVLHQSNDKIEFLEGDKVIASWERGTMSVDNLVALIQIQIGQHVVETYESTNPLVGISTIVRQV